MRAQPLPRRYKETKANTEVLVTKHIPTLYLSKGVGKRIRMERAKAGEPNYEAVKKQILSKPMPLHNDDLPSTTMACQKNKTIHKY